MNKFEYNIHWLLYDLFRIKSKFLCKKGCHLMALKRKIINREPIVEKTKEYTKTTYPKEFKTYRQCLCCGEKLDGIFE